MKLRGGVAALAVIVCVAACGSDDNKTAGSSTGSAPTEHKAISQAESAPDLPGKIVVRGTDSSCVSDSPSTGSVDLLGVDVHLGVPGYAGEAARVTWRLSGPLPTTGSAMVSLMAASADGEVAQQLGYKTVDGEQVGYFVFSGASQTNLSGYPDTSDPGVISGVLPSARVAELGTNCSIVSSVI